MLSANYPSKTQQEVDAALSELREAREKKESPMTRAESLDRLAHWAEWGAPMRAYPLDEMDEAKRHGLAAVRAIRTPICSCDRFFSNDWTFHRTACDGRVRATNEARLAVRCALAAVGLRPTRDGHHEI